MLLKSLFTQNNQPPTPANRAQQENIFFLLGINLKRGNSETKTVGDPAAGPYASYTIRNGEDNWRDFELSLSFRDHTGQSHASTVRAIRSVAPDVLDIQSITLDGQPETLSHPREIMSVLNFIGRQVRSIHYGAIPMTPKSVSYLTPRGRFITRHNPQRTAHWDL